LNQFVYFLKSSWKNLLKATALTSLIFYGLFGFLFGAVVIFGDMSGATTMEIATGFVVLLPLCSVGIAVMVMVIALASEFHEFWQREQILKKQPFSQLASLGFSKVQLFKTSFWKLFKEVELNVINDYIIVVDTQSRRSVVFTALTSQQPTLRLPTVSAFRDVEIYSTSAGLALKIPVESFSSPGISTLRILLENLTLTLKHAGVKPLHRLTHYESMLKTEMISKGLKPF
jgi:hypothetical protein